MTQLRQRMLEDLQIRNYSPNTQRAYVDRVAAFARYFGKSPDRLGPEEIRAYQLHLVQHKKVVPSTLNQAVCALRFFYRVTLQSDWNLERIPHAKREKKLPVVLSPDEVVQFFAAIRCLKYRSILIND